MSDQNELSKKYSVDPGILVISGTTVAGKDTFLEMIAAEMSDYLIIPTKIIVDSNPKRKRSAARGQTYEYLQSNEMLDQMIANGTVFVPYRFEDNTRRAIGYFDPALAKQMLIPLIVNDDGASEIEERVNFDRRTDPSAYGLARYVMIHTQKGNIEERLRSRLEAERQTPFEQWPAKAISRYRKEVVNRQTIFDEQISALLNHFDRYGIAIANDNPESSSGRDAFHNRDIKIRRGYRRLKEALKKGIHNFGSHTSYIDNCVLSLLEDNPASVASWGAYPGGEGTKLNLGRQIDDYITTAASAGQLINRDALRRTLPTHLIGAVTNYGILTLLFNGPEESARGQLNINQIERFFSSIFGERQYKIPDNEGFNTEIRHGLCQLSDSSNIMARQIATHGYRDIPMYGRMVIHGQGAPDTYVVDKVVIAISDQPITQKVRLIPMTESVAKAALGTALDQRHPIY